MIFCITKVNSQTLIHFWDFNQIRPLDGSGTDSLGTTFSYNFALSTDSLQNTWPLKPAYTKVNGAKIVYRRPQFKYNPIQRDSTLEGLGPGGAFIYDYSSSHYSYFTSSDSSFAEGNAFLKARNPSDSNEFWLYIPTTGCKGISLQFALSQSSGKGATYNIFSYSVNGGTSWKHLTRAMDTFNIGGVFHPDTLQADNPITSASNWYPIQIDFSSDTTVNNNPNFILRFRLAGASSTLQSGNDRYDNFAVWATTAGLDIDEMSVKKGEYSVFPNPTKNNLILKGSYEGAKSISIYNVLGQQMSVVKQ